VDAEHPIKVEWASDGHSNSQQAPNAAPQDPLPPKQVDEAILPLQQAEHTQSPLAAEPVTQAHATPASGSDARTWDADGGYKIFVGGLPRGCTEEELRSVFGTYGHVNKVHVMAPHAVTGQVAAFVFYESAQHGEDAISVLDHKYKIRLDAEYPIQVRWANAKERPGHSQGSKTDFGQKPQTNDGFKLYCGGLPSDITEEELRLVFSTYGEVTKVYTMHPHAVSGKVAGFIYYSTEKSGNDAIQVLNEQYKIRQDAERPIQVRWATPCNASQAAGDNNYGNNYGGWKDNHSSQKPNWSRGGQADNGWNSWQSSGSTWKDRSSGWKSSQGSWSQGGGNNHKDQRGGAEQLSDTKLFVGSLPGDVSEEALRYVFGTYGKVSEVHLMPGRMGGMSAFVKFDHPDQAETAIRTLHDNYEIKAGTGKIVVKKANVRPKPY